MSVGGIERAPSDAARLAQLRALYPEAFRDGRVSIEALRAALEGAAGDPAEDDAPYGLEWPGRGAAGRLAAQPPAATLRPVPGAGLDEPTTGNVLLVGDNLEILRLLQRSYARRVKLAYVDPPYNTGEAFIYRDRFSADRPGPRAPADRRGRRAGPAERGGRRHAAWLGFVQPRLALARSLLRDDGYLVVSIDDTEVANLRLLLDELFGEENFLATMVWDRNRKNDARFFSVGHEYMLVYAKSRRRLVELDTVLRAPKEGVDEVRALFATLRARHGDDLAAVHEGIRSHFASFGPDDPRKPLARFTKLDERGPYRDDGDVSWPGGGGPTYEIHHPVSGRPVKRPSRGWVFPTPERFWEEHAAGRVRFGPDETTVPMLRRDLFASAAQVMPTVQYSYAQTAARRFDALFGGVRVFDNPKPVEDLARLVEYLTGPDDLVLDFFAGSGTTGHAVWLANHRAGTHRRFVLAQLDEAVNQAVPAGRNAAALGLATIDAIAAERLRRAAAGLRAEGAVGDLGFRVLREARPPTGTDAPGAVAEAEAVAAVEARLVAALLSEGLPLDARRAPLADFRMNVVFEITHPAVRRRLLACTDAWIHDETIACLAAFGDAAFVCRREALDAETAGRVVAAGLRLTTA